MKTLHILIGPKGSGKTFIGLLVQERLGIPFLRVEDIFLRIKRDRGYLDADYVREGFESVETAIHEAFKSTNALIVESTGTAAEFSEMVERLSASYRVRLIKIVADSDICLKRVKTRDANHHIAVSDDEVMAINRIAAGVMFDFAWEIDNNSATEEKILSQFEIR